VRRHLEKEVFRNGILVAVVIVIVFLLLIRSEERPFGQAAMKGTESDQATFCPIGDDGFIVTSGGRGRTFPKGWKELSNIQKLSEERDRSPEQYSADVKSTVGSCFKVVRGFAAWSLGCLTFIDIPDALVTSDAERLYYYISVYDDLLSNPVPNEFLACARAFYEYDLDAFGNLIGPLFGERSRYATKPPPKEVTDNFLRILAEKAPALFEKFVDGEEPSVPLGEQGNKKFRDYYDSAYGEGKFDETVEKIREERRKAIPTTELEKNKEAIISAWQDKERALRGIREATDPESRQGWRALLEQANKRISDLEKERATLVDRYVSGEAGKGNYFSPEEKEELLNPKIDWIKVFKGSLLNYKTSSNLKDRDGGVCGVLKDIVDGKRKPRLQGDSPENYKLYLKECESIAAKLQFSADQRSEERKVEEAKKKLQEKLESLPPAEQERFLAKRLEELKKEEERLNEALEGSRQPQPAGDGAVIKDNRSPGPGQNQDGR